MYALEKEMHEAASTLEFEKAGCCGIRLWNQHRGSIGVGAENCEVNLLPSRGRKHRLILVGLKLVSSRRSALAIFLTQNHNAVAMRRFPIVLLATVLVQSTGLAQQQPTATSNGPVLKPPESRTGVSPVPTLFPAEPKPPLPPEAKRHEYLGYRLGIPTNEAVSVAKTAGKKLDEIERDKKYRMDGCLINVPRIEKAISILMFKDGKLSLIMVFWDDSNGRMYNDLMPMLIKKYGQPEKAEEPFRRFWILENGDCIRMLYDVSAHQTSLVYGSHKTVVDLNASEKQDINREYEGFP